MKKLLIIFWLIIGSYSLLSAQIDPGVDPHWGWQYKWPEQFSDTFLIDTAVLLSNPQPLQYILVDSLLAEPWWIYKHEPFEVTITLQDLFDYQKECYNDSGTYYTYIKDSIVYYKQETHPHEADFIIIDTHKPIKPTFEGFIEYMTKKYKK